MQSVLIRLTLLITVFCLLSACGIGQKTVLFTTRTNIGLDVDAKQFTAQLNIDRQEAVIGPTFEGGQHVPITAAFLNNNRLLGGFGVSSLFAGGDAALALTSSPSASAPCPSQGQSNIKLSTPPVFPKSPMHKFFDAINPFEDAETLVKETSLPGPGEVKPFVLDTDTTLGIKVSWSGATGGFPDKVKVGFNREEFALAPVMVTNATTVGVSSFFAALDTNSDVGSIFNSKFGFRQLIATGTSATNLACNPGIRAIIKTKFDLPN